jgi:hypothetical protein
VGFSLMGFMGDVVVGQACLFVGAVTDLDFE